MMVVTVCEFKISYVRQKNRITFSHYFHSNRLSYNITFMQYIIIMILLAYGVLNIRYCVSETDKIPHFLRFLLPQKIPGSRYAMLISVIFSFIPETKRTMVARLVVAIGCFFVAGQMLYVLST